MNKEKENKNAEISARIAEILQYTGDTRNGFAVKLGYERAQTVYDVMNMKSAPSYDFFRRFSVSEYSDIIDLKWLLSGEGSMLRDRSEESNLAHDPDAPPVSPTEESIYKQLYKEKDEENKVLLKQIGCLEERIRQLESQNKESDSHSMIDKVAEAFTSESSSGYGEDFMPAKPPSDSKRSSAGKV
ncbi:hypothetical protein [Bacteroides sp.]|uniref:hypothetical protein n=1 Tax=Bacteroides sp. TaxID=29523 RepID=UPI0025C46025|nr:hypothetical protein [Bacteroides sp.]